MSLYRGPSIIGTSADTTHAQVLSATAAALTAANEANGARVAQTAAGASATTAAASEAAVLASKNAAATSAANANTSAANSAGSATTAGNSASAANTSAANAGTSATNASTSATNSSNSATAANTAKVAAEAALDSFDDRYLGSKATVPTADNDGAALLVGTLYWDNTLGLRGYNGTAWVNLPATTASAVANTPAGNIAATTIQAAINELDTEKQVALGFAPIQQGGGTGQLANKLYVGWDGANLSLQVDASSYGKVWPISVTGNAATATNLTAIRTNWATNGTISAVVGQLGWKQFGNNHTIFDASNSTNPDGTAISNTNPTNAWGPQSPTLMGWNGTGTFGVRVDIARVAEVLSTTTGAAPIYAARAWVNFNGTGAISIRTASNVSSIADNGVGDYTVNFSTAMPSPSYITSVGACSFSTNDMTRHALVMGDATTGTTLKTATQLRVCHGPSNALGLTDSPDINVAIFI